MHYCLKVWGQNFLIQINTFIQKLHNKLIKSGNKDTYNATKHLYLKKKSCSCELSIHQRIQGKKNDKKILINEQKGCIFLVSTKILSTFNIDNTKKYWLSTKYTL